MEDEKIELLKCEPNYTIFFDNKSSKDADLPPTFTMSTDTTVMKNEIEKLEGTDGFHRYLSWLKEAHTHYETSVIEVLHKPFSSYWAIFRPRFFSNVNALHPFESIWRRATVYFKSDRLRRVFTFGSMYMGMSPYEAPGTYSLLQYTELAEGIWYPRGGFHVIVEKLVNVAERLGVKFRLNTAVDRVLPDASGKRATGVRLASGEVIEADVVVVNADLVWAYNHLFDSKKPSASSTQPLTNGSATNGHASKTLAAPSIPPSPSSFAKSLTKRPTSCSSISFYWSLNQKVPSMGTHNIFLAEQYRQSFESIFHHHELPNEPSFYVNIPSRVDPSAAPEGGDAVVILVPIGHLATKARNTADYSPNSEIVTKLRIQILDTLQLRTGIDFKPLISHEIVNTPPVWEEKFNLDRGAILGLSHGFFNVLAFRPRWKHETLSNTWFVGASTHPGTGVPIVLAGAKMISEEIIEHQGLTVPYEKRALESRWRTIDVVMGVLALVFVVMLGLAFGTEGVMVGPLHPIESAAAVMGLMVLGKAVEMSGGLTGKVIF